MKETVGTTEASSLLNISAARLRILLAQGRIKSARKEGRFWKIPLFKGMPKISSRKKGPKGTWKQKKSQKPILIHVNKPQIDRNRKHQTNQPVITIRKGDRKTRCHVAKIKGECRIIYNPNKPLNCGACVWIEIDSDTVVIPQSFNTNII